MAALGIFKRKEQPQMQQPNGGSSGFNEDFAEYVNNEYKRRQTERKSFELQWRLNSEFINGNQFLDINVRNQTIDEIPKFNYWDEREVFNQIGTIVETRLARLTRQMPTQKVRPSSSDDNDISSAKVSSMLLNSTWADQQINLEYVKFVAWLEFTGTVFWKPVWSTKKGRLIYQGPNPNGQPSVNTPLDGEIPTPEGMQGSFGDPNMIEIREGDIDTVVVNAYEFFPDSSYREDLRACRSVIHAKAFHINEIEEIWGVRVEGEEVDTITLQSSNSMGGMGYTGSTFRTGIQKLKNHAVVKEYYERPTRQYPQGRFIVVANKTTLYAGPMPFKLGQDGQPELPFIRCVSIEHPGCFWGKTIVERCIPIQRRYNAFRNRKAEYLNLVAIGQWYEPDGSLDEDTELNNAPGNIIRYRPTLSGQKPEPVDFPSLPSSFEIEEQTLLQEFTSISGVSELSRYSEAPSGVKSGVALGVASEQDDTRNASAATNIANSVQILGKYWLRLYRQFVQEPRILRSVGANRDVEVREWTASDLNSDDVFIENGSALSETPSQRRQMVFDLLHAGLFNRPDQSNLSEEGRQKVFQMLEYGHWESEAEDQYWLQKTRSRRENNAILQGAPVMVQDFDDHSIHIEQHNRQRMLIEYDELLQGPNGQMIDQIMRQHVGEHQQALQAQQANQPMGKPPNEAIAFKDLPNEGKIQMAKQVGIDLTPQALQKQADDALQAELTKAKASKPKPTPTKKK